MTKTSTLFFLMILPICVVFLSCEKTVVNEVKETITIRDTIRITDTLDVDRPLNVKATKGKFGTKISISWSPMPLASQYQLYRYDNTSAKYVLLKELRDTLYEDNYAFKPYEKIFYKVRSTNNGNLYSRYSDADFGYLSGRNYYFASAFGSEGTRFDQFNFPMHVETDAAGNIYVSDEGANRVLKFDPNGKYQELFYSSPAPRALMFLPNGNYITTRVQSSSYVQIFNSSKQLIKEWGTYGSGDDNFANIEELTVDDEQNIWIVDGVNHRIKKYDINGKLLLIFGKQGKSNGEFDAPFGICYLKNKIYVSDTRNQRIQVFDKNGKHLKTWEEKNNYKAIKAFGDDLYLATPDYIIKTSESGDVFEKIGEGNFVYLQGVAIARNGDVIACDVYGRSILTFKKG